MRQGLEGKKIAVLLTTGFEEEELTRPRQALEEAGAQVVIISPKEKSVTAWAHTRWGGEYKVDVPLEEADAGDYTGLLLPGGVMNPDKLRRNPQAVEFVKAFFYANKPVAAICHAPWLLIEANQVKGRRLTSYESLQTDLKNAGAEWVDAAVVVDGNLVTSRNPTDIPQFNYEMIRRFLQAEPQTTS